MRVNFDNNYYEKVKETIIEFDKAGKIQHGDMDTSELLSIILKDDGVELGDDVEYYNNFLKALTSKGVLWEADLTGKERECLVPTDEYYFDFVKNMTVEDIDLDNKLENLIGGNDIAYYNEHSLLYKLWEDAEKNGKENEFFRADGKFRRDNVKEVEKDIFDYIKNAMATDMGVKVDILTEAYDILCDYEGADTSYDALIGGIFNSDNLYLDAYNHLAEEKSKEKDKEQEEIDR